MLETYPKFVEKFNSIKSKSSKFDILLAYTKTLWDNSIWMHDHEENWNGPTFLRKLAKRWRDMLKQNDSVLGIEDGFTRKGVGEMLCQIKSSIESKREPDLEFNFDV